MGSASGTPSRTIRRALAACVSETAFDTVTFDRLTAGLSPDARAEWLDAAYRGFVERQGIDHEEDDDVVTDVEDDAEDDTDEASGWRDPYRDDEDEDDEE